MTCSQSCPASGPGWLWHAGLIGVVALWWLVHGQLIPVAGWITSLFPVDRHSHTGEAIAFLFHDVPKVMMLLTLIVFAMAGGSDAGVRSARHRRGPARRAAGQPAEGDPHQR